MAPSHPMDFIPAVEGSTAKPKVFLFGAEALYIHQIFLLLCKKSVTFAARSFQKETALFN
jgi:hypothetical protein